jgi:hypothetical protein
MSNAESWDRGSGETAPDQVRTLDQPGQHVRRSEIESFNHAKAGHRHPHYAAYQCESIHTLTA